MGAEGAKLLAVEKSMHNFTVVPFYLLLHIHGLKQTIDDIILSYVFIEKPAYKWIHAVQNHVIQRSVEIS